MRASAARTSHARLSTTRPVSPSTTASWDPPLRPATAAPPRPRLRGTRCRSPPLRVRPTDPDTAPRTRRRTRRGTGMRRRRAHVPGSARGRPDAALRRPGNQATPVTPGTRDRELHVGKSGDRVDEHVEALPRHEPAHAEHEWAIRVEAERPAGLGAGRCVAGVKALDVDAGWHDHAPQRRCRRRAPPRGPDSGRPRPHLRWRGAPAHRAGGVTGRRPGTVTSAPWTTGDVGRGAQARPEMTEREAMGRERSPAPRRHAPARRSGAPTSAVGKNCRSGARTIRKC